MKLIDQQRTARYLLDKALALQQEAKEENHKAAGNIAKEQTLRFAASTLGDIADWVLQQESTIIQELTEWWEVARYSYKQGPMPPESFLSIVESERGIN